MACRPPFIPGITKNSNLGCKKIPGFIPNRNWGRYDSPDEEYIDSKKLDMRRKVEILQYKKNNDKATKKQSYANIAKGFGSSRRLSQIGITSQNSCSIRHNQCTPTTSSDVPGKVMNLCFDKTVPLRRYITQRTYGTSGTVPSFSDFRL